MEEKIQLIVSSCTFSDICDLLCELMPTPSECYILIDGLDQCEARDRKELLKVLSALLSSNGNIRLFLSGRISLHDELGKKFDRMERLTLDCKDTQTGIEAYIEGSIEEKLEEGDLIIGDPTFVEELKSALGRGA